MNHVDQITEFFEQFGLDLYELTQGSVTTSAHDQEFIATVNNFEKMKEEYKTLKLFVENLAKSEDKLLLRDWRGAAKLVVHRLQN